MNPTIASPPLHHMPAQGRASESVLEELGALKVNDIPWESGKIFAYTFDPGEAVRKVSYAAYMKYLGENGLDFTVFPSTHKMEMDIVHTLRELLRGDEEVVGNCTSGGTESILCAVKTARDWARSNRPHITEPELILSETAHGAFHKACHYFNVKPVIIGYDPNTFQLDVDAMRNAITDNTILLVGSAPGYAQGVIDPIQEIGALALEKDLLFHVDACVGGIHLSFMRRMGYDLPDIDFSVPGVTSISADMHKYGYAPKGVSTVLYKNKALRFHQIFACRRTTLYALINPGVVSSKSGGPCAGAWATLQFLGEDGYQRIIKTVQDATRKFIDGINQINGLCVLGDPDMCMFSFASDAFNIFELADRVRLKGFYVQPQFSTTRTPPNLHITMDWGCVNVVDEALCAIREAVEEVKANPNPIDLAQVRVQVQGLLAGLGDAAPEALKEVAGITSNDLPTELALINSVMDALPDELAEHMMADYVNDMFV